MRRLFVLIIVEGKVAFGHLPCRYSNSDDRFKIIHFVLAANHHFKRNQQQTDQQSQPVALLLADEIYYRTAHQLINMSNANSLSGSWYALLLLRL